MGACDRVWGMGRDEYRGHVMDLAAQIRETAADKLMEMYEKGDTEQFDRIVREHNINLHVEDTGSLDSYRSHLREDHYGWVDDLLTRAVNLPEPAAAQPPLGHVSAICGDTALTRLTETGGDATADTGALTNTDPSGGLFAAGIFERIDTIGDAVEPWESGAVDMFEQYFLPGIRAAINQQVIVAKVLRNVVAANRAMLTLARADIDGVTHDTLTALEFEDGHWSGDNDTRAVLGVINGVATIAAGIATLPVSGPVGAGAIATGGFTVLAGSTSTWSALEGTRREEADGAVPLGADTIDGVLENMAEAVGRVYAELDTGNHYLTSDVLTPLSDRMREQPLEFVAPRPTDIADATPDTVTDVIEGS